MLRHMGWGEAADLLLKGISGGVVTKAASYDFRLLMYDVISVTCFQFSDCILNHM